MRDEREKLKYWENHREVTINLILERIKVLENNNGNMAIFGAGRCNDFDIKEILKHTEILYLLDKNKSHIEEGLANQELTENEIKRVKVIDQFDFTGIDNDFYIKVEEMFKQNCKLKNIVKFIRETANKLDTTNLLLKYKESFSIVVSSGVHSQLFCGIMELFEKYIKNYTQKEILNINQEINYLYSSGVIQYNNLLLNVLNSSGEIIYLLDLIEICEEKGTLNLLPMIEKSIKEGDPEIVNKLSNFLVMGSLQANEDILKRLNHEKLSEFRKTKKYKHKFWIWKFLNDRAYYINAYAINKQCFKTSK